jgi:hypothetical protein
VLLHGELDDQDRVLAEQAHQHHQRHLGVDVVLEPHQLEQQEGPEHADGQRQDHRQRQQEALVLADQHQVHEHDDDQEDVERLVAALYLVEGEARPVDVVAARQHLLGHLLDGADRLAAAVARAGAPWMADEG